MTVIPDSIEPVEEWRTWSWDGTDLLSHNGAVWQPNEPMEATCGIATEYWWDVVRYGMTLEEARTTAQSMNNPPQSLSVSSGFTMAWNTMAPWHPVVAVPNVAPPEGYGYALKPITHVAPSVGCSCGIYAGRKLDDCPAGVIAGKVKLWGTIVPGTKGSRAQFAYPSELHVPASLADDPGILAYGVPVVVSTAKQVQPFGGLRAFNARISPAPAKQGMPKALKFSMAINAGAAAFNLLVGFKVI